MYYLNTEEQLSLLTQSARDFANSFIKPHIMEWDESQIFPVELFRNLGNHGFMGIIVPEKYGGSGLSYQEYVSMVYRLMRLRK